MQEYTPMHIFDARKNKLKGLFATDFSHWKKSVSRHDFAKIYKPMFRNFPRERLVPDNVCR